MKPADPNKLWIPAVYGLLIIDLVEQRGVSRTKLLDGIGIPDAAWREVDGRISLIQAGAMLYKGVKLTGDGALGYEIGLSSNLTTHGFVGYGLLSHATVREAVLFGAGVLPLRLPNLSLRLFEDGAQGVVD
ncbi:MAG TPA: AraC family transcriptional regulator ligand-binding domain-containing protein, partial [Nevskiaceae bacterium]|nr:AraC family transcriptional regulator ligand-binding domain-containing protein [Nevskiaceae bacterium]